MTTKDDIVIRRDELPETVVTITSDSPPTIAILNRSKIRYHINQATAASVRAAAREQLAIAEGIDKILADQAKAEDDAKLREEAKILSFAANEITWGALGSACWMSVARAAREMHGK